jgi:hypothetical protein
MGIDFARKTIGNCDVASQHFIDALQYTSEGDEYWMGIFA